MTRAENSLGNATALESDRVLRQRLIDFIEASDPIRDLQTQRERRRLLDQTGAISAVPALEVTPSYAAGPGIHEIDLPEAAASILTEFARLNVGVYNPPYQHQAAAYHAILTEERDVLVTSGTGSGKTETFLHPILTRLMMEARQSPTRFTQSGMRVLILYPMNALVSDQIARLRRLFAAPAVHNSFVQAAGIPARFGMYTGRTPYPGIPSTKRNKEELDSIVRYYLDLQSNDAALFAELRSLGRIPAKDLAALRAALDAGVQRPATQPQDVELLTRHEMHSWCPHIMVTNYSMLEYMLMRPIERQIFEQTRALYQQDPVSRLLIVLDEAHLYRGVAGGEVSFLLRRLLARVGLDRDRAQFIFTSASLGIDDKELEAAEQFFYDLAGRPSNARKPLKIIKGVLATPSSSNCSRTIDGEALIRISEPLVKILDSGETLDPGILEQLHSLGLDIRHSAGATPFEQLGRTLEGWAPIVKLRALAHGMPAKLDVLAEALFSDLDQDRARVALQQLIEIAGRVRVDDRPILPARLHMFFRGIPPIYACINPSCSEIEETDAEMGLGKLYVTPRLHCDCGARTYELLIHRDCGARFLQVYEVDEQGDFFWHESGRSLGDQQPLVALQLLVDAPHRTGTGKCQVVYINIWTGRTQSHLPAESTNDWRRFYRPKRHRSATASKPTSTMRYAPRPERQATPDSAFSDCPGCGKRNGGRFIRSLGTVGDRPFATLVREQLLMLPPVEPRSERHPNEGRKSLIFSDGRQRAARLARDLPREIELDGFRQALLLAARRLEEIGIEPKFDRPLYTAFLSVCSDHYLTFFDQEGGAQLRLIEQVENFRRSYDCLQDAIADDDLPEPLNQYRLAVYRQVSDPNYSLSEINVGYIVPSKQRLKRLCRADPIARVQDAFPDDWKQILGRWIQGLLEYGAFDPGISAYGRLSIRPYQDTAESYSLEKIFPQPIIDRLSSVTLLANMTDILEQELTSSIDGVRMLDPSGLVLRIAIDDDWWRCSSCFRFFPTPIFGMCVECGSTSIEPCSRNHPLLRARSDYFRSGLRRVLAGERPVNLIVEEHTAQLSHRDRGRVWATTEEYELRFQDIKVDKHSPPIDILSCTTTMEVGVDIGALNAVGLGNVPPQRENYQQRAGRAGRRGSRLTTVMTYARDNAHDAHYFEDITTMVAGSPRRPRIDADNRRIAERHINALLIQSFFHRDLNGGKLTSRRSADLFSSLGNLEDFYSEVPNGYTCGEFEQWSSGETIQSIVPPALLERVSGLEAPEAQTQHIRHVREGLIQRLQAIGRDLVSGLVSPNEMLLDVLFDRGLLPSYAFPTDLCSFVIQRPGTGGRAVEIEQKPQQDKVRALSEYAPGRQLIVDKRTYTVGGVFVDGVGRPDERFQRYFPQALTSIVYCPRCTYVGSETGVSTLEVCPVCHTQLRKRVAIDPPAFSPKGGKADDGTVRQTYTTATQAQFPLPLEDQRLAFEAAGQHLLKAFQRNQQLVVSNTGLNDQGFLICTKCGAIEPKSTDEVIGEHYAPFLGTKGYPFRCNGNTYEHAIVLSHMFSTDLLLIRGQIAAPLVEDPTANELQDALRTLAEAFALTASYLLDADPGELSSGYRFRQREDDTLPFEIFLYDAAAGGAGYALEAGERFTELLDAAESLLRTCPAECERSCTRCLRHYGNLPWHRHLDRHLALSFLRYLRYGEMPENPSGASAASMLLPLERFLQLEGFECQIATTLSNPPQLVISNGDTHNTVTLRASLIAGEEVQRSGKSDFIIGEYTLARGLPSVASSLSEFLKGQ